MKELIFIVFFNIIILTQGKRPHIVFILTDDHGWNDISFHGSLQIPTPNLDILAANGVVLNNYYVQPLCSPSRAALLTGRHPIHLGLQHGVILEGYPAGLPLNVSILPQHLKKFGYATHGIGKWHLGYYKRQYLPTNRGFDSFFGLWTGHMDYYDYTELIEHKNFSMQYAWGDVLRDDLRLANEFKGNYSTHLFTDKAIDIINKHHKSQPLFLYMAPNAVHSGNKYALYRAPYKEVLKFAHISQENRRIFAGVVSSLDDAVGQIFAALDKNNMLDNTIFIISTDNGGEAAGLRDGIGSNWPLRGNKATLWEGGIKGIGMIWSKLLKQQPRIENGLMHISDWLPTLYYAAGGNIKDLGNIYGLNQWETISTGTASPREELLHNIDPIDGASALRFKNYKIVTGSNLGGQYNGWYGPTGRENQFVPFCYENLLRSSYVWSVLSKRRSFNNVNSDFLSKLELKCSAKTNVSNCNPNVSPCLFDISADPCELENIANLRPKVLQSMLNRLEEFKSTAVPIVNQTIDPLSDPAFHHFAWTNWGDCYTDKNTSIFKNTKFVDSASA